MIYHDPSPPNPHDDTATGAAAHKSEAALSNLPVWLSCAVGIGIGSLSFWWPGPWIADVLGVPRVVGPLVWVFFLLLLLSVGSKAGLVRARDRISR